MTIADGAGFRTSQLPCAECLEDTLCSPVLSVAPKPGRGCDLRPTEASRHRHSARGHLRLLVSQRSSPFRPVHDQWGLSRKLQCARGRPARTSGRSGRTRTRGPARTRSGALGADREKTTPSSSCVALHGPFCKGGRAPLMRPATCSGWPSRGRMPSASPSSSRTAQSSWSSRATRPPVRHSDATSATVRP